MRLMMDVSLHLTTIWGPHPTWLNTSVTTETNSLTFQQKGLLFCLLAREQVRI